MAMASSSSSVEARQIARSQLVGQCDKFRETGFLEDLELLNNALKPYLDSVIQHFSTCSSRPKVNDPDFEKAAAVFEDCHEMSAIFREVWGQSWKNYNVYQCQHFQKKMALVTYVKAGISVCDTGADLDKYMQTIYEVDRRPKQQAQLKEKLSILMSALREIDEKNKNFEDFVAQFSGDESSQLFQIIIQQDVTTECIQQALDLYGIVECSIVQKLARGAVGRNRADILIESFDQAIVQNEIDMPGDKDRVKEARVLINAVVAVHHELEDHHSNIFKCFS